MDKVSRDDRVLGQAGAVAMEVGKVVADKPEDGAVMLERVDDGDRELSGVVIVCICELVLEAIVETCALVAVRVPCVIGRALLMSLQSS